MNDTKNEMISRKKECETLEEHSGFCPKVEGFFSLALFWQFPKTGENVLQHGEKALKGYQIAHNQNHWGMSRP